jgi:hypothetical protein
MLRIWKVSDEKEWDELMVLAATLEPVISQAFLLVADRLRAAYTLDQIQHALDSGRVSELLDHLTTNAQTFAPLSTAVSDSATKVAAETLDELPAAIRSEMIKPQLIPGAPHQGPRRPTSGLAVVYDGHNPAAVDAVQGQGARLVTEVSDGVRAAIKDVIDRGIRSGVGTADMASEIKQFIGLTTTQIRAVQNFRGMLENLDRSALDMELRDRRFDPTLERAFATGTKLSATKIDQMVEARRQKALTYRANNIARTEAISALTTGRRVAWQQVVRQGGVKHEDVRQFWHVSRDERTCDECSPIPRMNPEGVPLGGFFVTPSGSVEGPTLHPHCRCVVFIRPFFR